MDPLFEICNTTHRALPPIPFQKIARAALGKGYYLSVVICGDTLAKRMNKTHRKKSYPANVLSFPLTHNEGEIFLNVDAAKREARRSKSGEQSRIALLFVHGCLHLKNLRHGKRMERAEKKILTRFKLSPLLPL